MTQHRDGEETNEQTKINTANVCVMHINFISGSNSINIICKIFQNFINFKLFNLIVHFIKILGQSTTNLQVLNIISFSYIMIFYDNELC